eukprot:TRINITY_DN2852_c0_g1_i3.p1 TRINITY_DN2852_c0_g1~~TRINITY_DN2852_c0_g1_i3.p1  ORF type:complete len:160 (+),score=31.18 TRINITY_DN2852_c0_g1_i3:320-799(+)
MTIDSINYAASIAKCLAHIHKENLVHRDIKPENIYLTKDNCIKLGDLATTLKIPNNTIWGTSNQPSSLIYEPVEVRKSGTLRLFNTSTDVYAFGVLLFELFSKENAAETLKVKDMECGNRPDLDKFQIDPKIVEIIDQCWSVDPLMRPTFEQILSMLQN